MPSCNECRKRFRSWGDSPAVRSGRYHLSACDYCPYYMSPEYRLEKLEDEILVKPIEQPRWAGKQWDTVQQLQGMVRHLESKVMEKRVEDRKKSEPF